MADDGDFFQVICAQHSAIDMNGAFCNPQREIMRWAILV